MSLGKEKTVGRVSDSVTRLAETESEASIYAVDMSKIGGLMNEF